MSETIEGTPTLKRKASLSPPAEDVTLKRVKEENVTERESDGNTKTLNNSAAVSNQRSQAMDTSPPAPGPEPNAGPTASRKSIALDEKKRAKRLFGGILGTLSQKPSTAQQKRKLEVDRRQHERLQKQREESDKLRADKLARRRALRAQEQDKIEEERMEARHSRMLAAARSLKTKSEPRLYYQPWELTEEQEDIIDDQIHDAKETIERELREFRLRRGISDDNHSHARKDPEAEKSRGPSSPRPESPVGERKKSLQDTNHGTAPAHTSSLSSKDKDPDDIGGEMVHDKEDTVIY